MGLLELASKSLSKYGFGCKAPTFWLRLSAQAGSARHTPSLEQMDKKKMPSVKHKGREGRIVPTHSNDPAEVVMFYVCLFWLYFYCNFTYLMTFNRIA